MTFPGLNPIVASRSVECGRSGHFVESVANVVFAIHFGRIANRLGHRFPRARCVTINSVVTRVRLGSEPTLASSSVRFLASVPPLGIYLRRHAASVPPLGIYLRRHAASVPPPGICLLRLAASGTPPELCLLRLAASGTPLGIYLRRHAASVPPPGICLLRLRASVPPRKNGFARLFCSLCRRFGTTFEWQFSTVRNSRSRVELICTTR